MDIAHEIWMVACDRYHLGDVFCISDFPEELFNLKQGGPTITQYYTNLKKLWKELDNFWPFPTCSCNPKFSYNLISTFKSYRYSNHVIRFLKGLNEQYVLIQSQIMLMTHVPHINKALSMLIQQERQLMAPFNEENKVLANFSKFDPHTRPYNHNNKTFNYRHGRGNRS